MTGPDHWQIFLILRDDVCARTAPPQAAHGPGSSASWVSSTRRGTGRVP